MIILMVSIHVTIPGQMANLVSVSNYASLKGNKLIACPTYGTVQENKLMKFQSM